MLGADRGEDAHKRTMDRMNLSLAAIPFKPLPLEWDLGAAQAIADHIEATNPAAEIVFVEGVDMLVTEVNNIKTVARFVHELQKIAQHYRIALIGSLGSPKVKEGHGYTATRDNLLGSGGSGATTETVALLSFPKNDDTSGHRNACESPLDVLIDRITVTTAGSEERVREALEKAFYVGAGRARAMQVERHDGPMEAAASLEFNRRFNCSGCSQSFAEPVPALFSDNSPIGACAKCEGFGRTVELNLEKVIPNPLLSLRQGAVMPWRTPAYREMQDWMLKCARRARVRTGVTLRDMTAEESAWLLDGESRQVTGRRKRTRDGPKSSLSFAGSSASATRPMSEFSWPGTAGSSPARIAMVRNSSLKRSV